MINFEPVGRLYILEVLLMFHPNYLQNQLPKSFLQTQKSMSKTRGIKKQEVSAWQWKEVDTCIVGCSSASKGQRIAGFDMDSTLIQTKSGQLFAQNAADWVYWHESVPGKLKQLSDEGFKIVIFTNQKGISLGKSKAEDIKKKIEVIASSVGVEMDAYIATCDDICRKPNKKMWQLFIENNGAVDLAGSFYCGDAAGRKDKDGKKKDFSDSDIKFAFNVGIPFKTPENLFLDDKKEIQIQGFNPANIAKDEKLFANSEDKNVKFVEKEMVIFCGSPGAGKSTFWQNYMPQYERVNRDTLKTKEKCYAVAQKFLKEGKSVVIDNTNPKKEDRKYFLDLAKKLGVKARAFYFLTPKEVCFHNDGQRVSNTVRKHLSSKAGKVPIYTWWKYQEKPTTAQGFYEVKQVNFVTKFTDDKDREQYLKLGAKL